MRALGTTILCGTILTAVCGEFAVGQNRPRVDTRDRNGNAARGTSDSQTCFWIETDGVGRGSPFNRICIDINDVAQAPHPMEGDVTLVSATYATGAPSSGWSLDNQNQKNPDLPHTTGVVFEDNRWQLCISRPSNETSNVKFKVCIAGAGRERATLGSGAQWNYFRNPPDLQGGSGSGARRPTKSFSAATCPSDLDGNGVVDGADLGILLSNWGTGEIGDLDGNGVVDGADLGILLSNWGECVEPPCDDLACLQVICEVNPACCDGEWDLVCDWLTAGFCGCPEPLENPWHPVDHACDQSSESPSCADPGIGVCVCELSPYCCTVAWDAQCVELAYTGCGMAGDALTIVSVDSTQFSADDILAITAVNFPDDVNDLHLSIRPWMPDWPWPDPEAMNEGGIAGPGGGGIRLIPIAVVGSTVVTRVAAVPPTFPVGTPGAIFAQVGAGAVSVPPGIPSVVTPQPPGPIWWSASLLSQSLAQWPWPVFPVPYTPPPCSDHHGSLAPLSLDITIIGSGATLDIGTTLEVTIDAALSNGALQFAQQMTLQINSPMTVAQAANALCATLQGVFFQQTGQFFPCTAQVVGPDSVQLSIAPPFGDSFDPAQFNTFWVRICEP